MAEAQERKQKDARLKLEKERGSDEMALYRSGSPSLGASLAQCP
jgi:hypothetical protein